MFKLNSKEKMRVISSENNADEIVSSSCSSEAIAVVADDEQNFGGSESLPSSPSNDLRIVSQLGSGGMGVVYKARHKAIDKTLAVKMLHPKLTGDSQLVKRFENEARAASLLTHVNLASVYEYGVSEKGEPYLIMDYVDGQTLQEILRNEKSLEIPRFMHIFKQVCDALIHAHTKLLLHRDLKPANIMLINSDSDVRADFVKLVDFGIAKLLPQATTDEQRLTQTGEVLGSPVYMCPEQCLGNQPDARGDIYSLGCVMYEALVGRPPFLRDNVVQTILSHLNELPIPLTVLAPHRGISPELEKIVLKCLQKDPEKRFQTVQDLKDSLELIEPETSESAKKRIAARLIRGHLGRVMKKHRLMSFIAVFVGLVICSAGSIALWTFNQEKTLQDLIDTGLSLPKDKSTLGWQRAIAIAETLHKPDKTVARLYLQFAFSMDSYNHAVPLKENALKRAIQLFERSPLAKTEYLKALQNLDAYYNGKANWKQPIAALQALENKAQEALLFGKYDVAQQFFEDELKVDADCCHAKIGLAKIAEVHAGNASPTDRLKYLHKANYLCSFWPNQEKTRSDILDEAIRALGKDPNSHQTRVELAESAERSGDLEGASLEYQAALRMQAEPNARRHLQQITQQILERNDEQERGFLNSFEDRRIVLLERLVREQEAFLGREQTLDANVFHNLSALKLPATKIMTGYDQTASNLRSLAETYSARLRFCEAEFVYKKMFIDQPNFIWDIAPTAFDRNSEFGNCPLGLLSEVVAERSNYAEAIAYDQFLVEKCLPALGSEAFASCLLDDRVFYGWIDALQKSGKSDEENRVKKMRSQRLREHINDVSGDAFSTGGCSGDYGPERIDAP